MIMENARLELMEVLTHGCDVKTFRFKLPRDIDFKPGQYLILTLNINGQDVPKAFSISNSPTEKGFIQFTKKISSSDYSKALTGLKTGTAHPVRFPMGKFTFTGEYPRAVFLSGGIGITPIRSIFKYATDRKCSSDLVLLYTSRTPEYLIFRNDFIQMAKENQHIRPVFTLTQCDEAVEGCRLGAIDDELIRREIPDFSEWVFYICGPPGMVDVMRSMLRQKLFIPENRIVTEDFIGY
jgi:ferredoxin-NADP reductase